MGKCVDGGKTGCPCALFPAGKCSICSFISKGNCNQCNWQGACIYAMYREDGLKTQTRTRYQGSVIEKKDFGENLKVLVVNASKGFCQEASKVGAVVFCRNASEEQWYDMPVSVLKAEPEKERIHLGINLCGPKSISLCKGNKLIIRGVYRSGLLGLDVLSDERNESLVYCKGIGIAPLRNILDGGFIWTKYLKNMKVYIDLDKIDLDFLKEYFGDLPCGSIEIVNMKDLEFKEHKDANIFAFLSPYYTDKIEKSSGIKIVKTNNGTLCCGEGICGACSFDDGEGKTVHLCKAT